MSFIHKIQVFFIGLCCSLLLTSCAQADIHMSINWDLSGTYSFRIVNDPRLSKITNWLSDHYRQKGYLITSIKTSEEIGFSAEKKVKNILDSPIQQDFPDFSQLMNSWTTILQSDLPSLQSLDSAPSKTKPNKHLTWNSDLFTTQIRYRNTELDLTRLPVNKLYASYQHYFGKKNETPPSLLFQITLPIAPDNSNASQVRDEGKTLGWDLKFGQKNPIFMTAEIPNPITVGILSLLALLFLGVVLFTTMKKRKSAKK
ncbi:Protein of unknown function [Thermoactinomyces sp. DSM 45891]|uniref:DUF3153 domain-containing protein n=1 Tax=Thermoactinomyces sp. DSM 45891 TaxID=1761907 RepID=UPI00091EF85F|nr:DUF3153 domain-containing protein [Thermoactinomyces sp. DSM 45891]SFX51173.1 Protein of unknown function [Thermoactinomyces sp. DSM 45891]